MPFSPQYTACGSPFVGSWMTTSSIQNPQATSPFTVLSWVRLLRPQTCVSQQACLIPLVPDCQLHSGIVHRLLEASALPGWSLHFLLVELCQSTAAIGGPASKHCVKLRFCSGCPIRCAWALQQSSCAGMLSEPSHMADML